MPTWPLAEIRALIEPSLAHMGYTIHELRQSGRDGRTLLLAIDKAEGLVGIADCERVSGAVGPLLDHADLIPDRYVLEVSSPGAERPLRDRADYARFLGMRVNVRERTGDEQEVVVEGKLSAVDDGGIEVVPRSGQVRRVDWDRLLGGRLVATP